LAALEIHDIGDGITSSQLLAANAESLQRLSLGQVKDIDKRYKQTRVGFLTQIQPLPDIVRDRLQLNALPQLRHLDLCGVDLSSLTPSTVEEALPLCRLRRVSMESCSGTAEFLEAMAGVFFYAQNPADAETSRVQPLLTEFLLRCEAPSNAIRECLTRFLASFGGLKLLSLLFENAAFLESVASLIADHGPTLRTLVLESRIQPRSSLSHDTSRPFGVGGFSEELWEQSVNDVCRLCPNLEELGIGFPWGDETVRLRRTLLPTLKNLRTIHVRNFPVSQVLSQLGDYTIKEYASKFIEWVFPPSKGGAKPRLEVLAIGPTLYESRYASNTTRRQVPEYLRSHYFCLDFGQTRFGRWSAMVTPISERYVEEIREEKPLGGVFEQVWLQ
jgi:hypothetical protein